MAVVVPVVADTSGLTRGLNKAEGGLGKFAKRAGVAAGAVGVSLVYGLKKCIDSASNLNESISKTDTVFGKNAKAVKDWSKKSATAMGQSQQQALEAASTYGNLFQAFGMGLGPATKMSTTLTQLASDLASFNNTSVDEAIEALRSGLSGETEPLKRYGVAINDVRLKEEAMRLGLIKTTKDALTPAAKAQAAYALVMHDTKLAQGDFARTSDGLANSQKTLSASFENLKAGIGTVFLPIVARAVGQVADFIAKLSAAPTMTAKIKLIVSAIGDIAWTGIRSLYEWWNRRAERVELPARVIFVNPGGRQQLDAIVASLEPAASSAGRRLGIALAEAMISGSVSGLTDKMSVRWARVMRAMLDPLGATMGWLGRNLIVPFVSNLVSGLTDKMSVPWARVMRAMLDPLGATMGWLGRNLIVPFVSNLVSGLTERLGPAIAAALRDAINYAIDLVKNGPGGFMGRLVNILPNGMPRPRKGENRVMSQAIADRLTMMVQDAIPSARASLASAGSSLAGMLSERVSAGFRLGGTGMDSKEMVAAQRDLEDRRLTLQEQSLRDALAAADDKTEAQLALDEFLLQKEATLRQRGVDDANAANTQQINDLVASFNSGAISAQDFRDRLNGIIGAAPGADLGGAFAGAFDTQLQTVLSTAEEISATIAEALGLAGVGKLEDVLGVVKNANDKRFSQYLANWNALKARRESIVDEQDDIIDDEDATAEEKQKARAKKARILGKIAAMNANKKTRADFGLALGGVLNKQVFTAGEAGPEAVMPLTGRGGVMLRDALGLDGKSQGATYNITVNAGMGASGIDLGREIVAAIKQYERTNGNVFASA